VDDDNARALPKANDIAILYFVKLKRRHWLVVQLRPVCAPVVVQENF